MERKKEKRGVIPRFGKSAGPLLKIFAALAFLALVFVWAKSLAAADGGTTTEKEVFGHLTALLVLVLYTGLIQLWGRSVGGLVLGEDNRVSTSKFQFVLWTYAIAAALLSLIAQTWVGADSGFEALKSGDVNFEAYLVLLGGPFLAAVGAKAIVEAQVENGDAAKPPGQPKASQALTNDSGDADLIDCQYLLFNLIALIFFLGAFGENPAVGLPAIPTFLYVLTGAAALGYVSNKAIPSGPPKIESISPATGREGSVVTIFGNGLLFPLEAAVTATPTRKDEFHEVQAMVGGRRAEIVEGSFSSTKAGGDRFRIKVPAGLKEGEDFDVVALNFRGTRTNPARFHVAKSRAPRRPFTRNGGRRSKVVE